MMPFFPFSMSCTEKFKHILKHASEVARNEGSKWFVLMAEPEKRAGWVVYAKLRSICTVTRSQRKACTRVAALSLASVERIDRRRSGRAWRFRGALHYSRSRLREGSYLRGCGCTSGLPLESALMV